jgi:hypothetical protein
MVSILYVVSEFVENIPDKKFDLKLILSDIMNWVAEMRVEKQISAIASFADELDPRKSSCLLFFVATKAATVGSVAFNQM